VTSPLRFTRFLATSTQENHTMDSPNAPTMAPNPPTYAELKRSHPADMTYADLATSAATYEASALKYTTEEI
jgi:hypothetical protein